MTLLGNENEITIEVWTRSHLAYYLDNDREGHWLRECYLGIKAQRLSIDLLQTLSQKSINIYAMMINEEKTIIPRDFDQKLLEIYSNPVTFLIGESGYGKTVSCSKN